MGWLIPELPTVTAEKEGGFYEHFALKSCFRKQVSATQSTNLFWAVVFIFKCELEDRKLFLELHLILGGASDRAVVPQRDIFEMWELAQFNLHTKLLATIADRSCSRLCDLG